MSADSSRALRISRSERVGTEAAMFSRTLVTSGASVLGSMPVCSRMQRISATAPSSSRCACTGVSSWTSLAARNSWDLKPDIVVIAQMILLSASNESGGRTHLCNVRMNRLRARPCAKANKAAKPHRHASVQPAPPARVYNLLSIGTQKLMPCS
ncbi:hypothetical protein D9M72_558250 [compost metagenome]